MPRKKGNEMARPRKKASQPQPPLPQPREQRAVDDKGRFMEVLINMEEWADIVKAKRLKTKSAMIRYLWNTNHRRRAIADFLHIRYQHVRNVLTRLPKKPSTLAEMEPGGDAEVD